MNNTSASFKWYPYLIFFLLLLFVHPVNAQQRSQHDLAAWIIAAVADNDTMTINWALHQGGNLDYKRSGNTALAQAIQYKKVSMVAFLLKKGAKTDNVNEEGLTALQFAEKTGDQAIISLLRGKAQQQKETGSQTSDATIEIKPTGTESSQSHAGTKTDSYHYRVGQKVLHSRDKGKTWEPGTVKAISTSKELIASGISPYLIENEKQTVQNYLDTSFITTLIRQPYWTSFFFGDWDLYLPITAVDRKIDRDPYTVISGGQKLPPLRINSNGTYTWVINKNKVVHGVWENNTNAPGIILKSGDRSDNWLMYNSTDNTNRGIYKSDYIILTSQSEKYSQRHGFRISKKR